MKKVWVAAFFLFILACNATTPTAVVPTTTSSTSTPATPTVTSTPIDLSIYKNIKVIGSQEFLLQTHAALALLEEKDPPAFNKIQTYVGIIEQGEHSGMWAWETPPRYEVGDASTIAHDATHSELYHRYLESHPGEVVPENAYGGVDNERFCNGYQLEVLKRIGAPQSEIEYMATQDGTHCDVDGDGDCDWDDYLNRNW